MVVRQELSQNREVLNRAGDRLGSQGRLSPRQSTTREGVMSESKGQVRIELTAEQKAKIRAATGKDAEAVELSVEDLEERIAPSTLNFKKGS
jgi:hypothetical protein